MQVEEVAMMSGLKPTVSDVSRKPSQHRRKSHLSACDNEKVKKLLAQSPVLKANFARREGAALDLRSKRQRKRDAAKARDATTGKEWFNMRRVAEDDPRHDDAEIIRSRAALTNNNRYRDETDVPLPKYFQVGTIVSTVADRYSDVPRKERRQTIVDEILADREVLDYQRSQFRQLREEEHRMKMRHRLKKHGKK